MNNYGKSTAGNMEAHEKHRKHTDIRHVQTKSSRHGSHTQWTYEGLNNRQTSKICTNQHKTDMNRSGTHKQQADMKHIWRNQQQAGKTNMSTQQQSGRGSMKHHTADSKDKHDTIIRCKIGNIQKLCSKQSCHIRTLNSRWTWKNLGATAGQHGTYGKATACTEETHETNNDRETGEVWTHQQQANMQHMKHQQLPGRICMNNQQHAQRTCVTFRKKETVDIWKQGTAGRQETYEQIRSIQTGQKGKDQQQADMNMWKHQQQACRKHVETQQQSDRRHMNKSEAGRQEYYETATSCKTRRPISSMHTGYTGNTNSRWT